MHFFTNRVSTMWNQLPNSIVNASSLNIFKARLDFWHREEENKKKLGSGANNIAGTLAVTVERFIGALVQVLACGFTRSKFITSTTIVVVIK
ncbi:hypothetical protein BpHYR1_042979 [Brachionus plicatilis]|uniref:RNA-directed DNA polymerase from mobile element jockey-like n=1 Tax=Brachionus plicatilis TaxID=10195 RepID=A0A3M7PEA0_BRAPC|nr:hypothetical protein BpHYR1_042979 [Brachionus plicatilis]